MTAVVRTARPDEPAAAALLHSPLSRCYARRLGAQDAGVDAGGEAPTRDVHTGGAGADATAEVG